jgi:hypothetical protein
MWAIFVGSKRHVGLHRQQSAGQKDLHRPTPWGLICRLTNFRLWMKPPPMDDEEVHLKE